MVFWVIYQVFPFIRRPARAILIHFPPTSLHVAILRRGALQMGTPASRPENCQKNDFFYKESMNSGSCICTENPSISLLWGSPDAAPPSQTRKCSTRPPYKRKTMVNNQKNHSKPKLVYSEPGFLTKKTKKNKGSERMPAPSPIPPHSSRTFVFFCFLVKNQGSEYTSFGLLCFFWLFTMFSFHKEAW